MCIICISCFCFMVAKQITVLVYPCLARLYWPEPTDLNLLSQQYSIYRNGDIHFMLFMKCIFQDVVIMRRTFRAHERLRIMHPYNINYCSTLSESRVFPLCYYRKTDFPWVLPACKRNHGQETLRGEKRNHVHHWWFEDVLWSPYHGVSDRGPGRYMDA